MHQLWLRATVLNWFMFYHRNQYIIVNVIVSIKLPLKFVVPQGSVLRPVYTLYTMLLSYVIGSVHMFHHMYADDTKFYVSALRGDKMSLSISINAQSCKSIKSWMQYHKLKLNGDKTEILLCSTENKLK